jgi:YVTN family beta-propeller protein
VGTAPSDVAVNPATGIAIVANKGSNDVTLIDLKTATPTLITSICTIAVATPPPCPASTPSGPTGVSVDYVRNIALVVNSTSKTIAVVDLNAQAVSFVLPVLQDTPNAVGINPVTGRALVAMQQKNYGVLVDVTQNPPAYAGIVSISTGSNTHVAVEPNLNWALATPGTLGSLGIVDLNRQSTNAISAISRTNNGTTTVVTVTVQSSSSQPLAVQVGDAVQIQNLQITCASSATPDCTAAAGQASSFDGFFSVSSAGPGPNQFSYTQADSTLPNVATQSSPFAATGAVNYSQPVATVGLPATVQGVAINPETQQAALFDPGAGGVVSFFSLIDQSVSPLGLTANSGAAGAGAYNPLTNTVVAVNFFANTLSVLDPSTPRSLNDSQPFATLPGPIAVAIDPGTNIAVVANQKDNSVSVLNLGAIKPFSITETSPKVFMSTSTLASGPSPAPLQLTVIGKGLTCTNGSTTLNVRLDGIPIQPTCTGNGDRMLTVTVPANLLTSARRFALDVADSSGNVTNAEDFTVEQSVDVSACGLNPQPAGVAIDPKQNIAAVTLFGCNSLALINMSTGTGSSVSVGSNPIGVAVIPRLHLAVVANNGGAGTASIVDELAHSVTQTVAAGSGPIGVAADEATGKVAIANSVANTVSVIDAVTGGVASVSTGQRPVAVAYNYVTHQLAVAVTSGNSVGISTNGGSVSQSFNINAPTSVVYDPVTTDCGSNSGGTTTNTTGCFIANSSTGNVAEVIDPVSSVQTVFRIGINPTAIAYNFLTSTLVSTNTASHTITVADFLAQKIRAVMNLPPTAAANSGLAQSLAFSGSLQYGLDVHPLTNIAVIADTANGRVLFVPLPH